MTVGNSRMDYKMVMERGPNIRFYVPNKIGNDYCVVLYPGFGRPSSFYNHIGKSWAENGHVTAIPDWDGGSRFDGKKIIESVYTPVDVLKNNHYFKNVVGIGHSYGGERLLKAALQDTENRFDAITLVQPPERLGKYINNHSYLYSLSKSPFTRAFALAFSRFKRRDLHMRSISDQRHLLSLIDNDSSLLESIDTVQSYLTPTRLIYSPADTHVSYKDSLEIERKLKEKCTHSDRVGLAELDKHLTIEQMEEVFRFSKEFFDSVLNGEEIRQIVLNPEPGIA